MKKTTRRYTVYEDSTRKPFICIKAKWLEQCGFSATSKYEIKISKDTLILKKLKESK